MKNETGDIIENKKETYGRRISQHCEDFQEKKKKSRTKQPEDNLILQIPQDLWMERTT